jgi:hypothetical protein
MLIVLSASLPKIYNTVYSGVGHLRLNRAADRHGVCEVDRKSKAPAVAFNAIELDGSCHGFPVLPLGIWQKQKLRRGTR